MKSIRDRLQALLVTVLQDSRINKSFHKIIVNLAEQFLKDVSDEDLRKGIEELRDRYIPWILNGDQQNENQNQQ